jgi:3-hydroxy-9,10-secoandrosta-1,3,5(10)-triene-9,17-dione monooxygenase reductase component
MAEALPVQVQERAREFRNALGAFATGVTVITTRDVGGADVGMTANSFNSVSLDPPMILWSIGKNSTNLDSFMQAERFAVHVLAMDQEKLSGKFARQGTDKFAGVAIERGISEVPLLVGAAARFQCRTAFRHEAGDHYIIVGEVEEFDHDGHAPLAFHSGGYGMFVRNEPAVGGAVPEDASLGELLARVQRKAEAEILAGLTDHEANLLRRLLRRAAEASL